MDDMYLKGILYAAKLAEQEAKNADTIQAVVQRGCTNSKADVLTTFASMLKKRVTDDIMEQGAEEYYKYSTTSD